MIILASSSPRRIELLKTIVSEFKVIPPSIDESKVKNSDPEEKVKRIAFLKASAVYKTNPRDTIIASDTLVYFNKKFLGKPKNYKDAYLMLSRLSGQVHEVYTSVCVIYEKKIILEVTKASVGFKNLTDNEIKDYLATSEPWDKAGSYAFQGIFNKHIIYLEGDPETVIGFPTLVVKKCLERVNEYAK